VGYLVSILLFWGLKPSKMMSLQMQTAFLNEPFHLDQNSDPATVIANFFVDFSLADVRDILWQMTKVGLTTENEQYSEAVDRADLYHHYSRLEELIEAAYMINEGNKKAPQKA
jgi:hypothetical protein